jgi:hypothetical protein
VTLFSVSVCGVCSLSLLDGGVTVFTVSVSGVCSLSYIIERTEFCYVRLCWQVEMSLSGSHCTGPSTRHTAVQFHNILTDCSGHYILNMLQCLI